MTDASPEIIDPVETAVRRYLLSLTDPDALLDRDRADDLEKQIATTDDPLDKLRLYGELHRCTTVDKDELTAEFIRHARTWARSHDIPPSAFETYGVPRQVLDEAFTSIGRAQRGAPRRPRERKVTYAQAKELILGQDDTFTGRDIVTALGGNGSGTVSTAMRRLRAEGLIEQVGQAAKHPDMRGAPPMLWRVKR